jgi:hypothetical protein
VTPKPPKKRGPKRGKSAAAAIERSLDDALTEQMRATARAVFEQIEKRARAGKDVPISLLGAARLLAEWHTDYLTVQSATRDTPPASAEKGK